MDARDATFPARGHTVCSKSPQIPENDIIGKGNVMKRAHAEDRSIIYLGAVTLVVIATCWALCLA